MGCEGNLANDTMAALNRPSSSLCYMKAVFVVAAEGAMGVDNRFSFGQTFCEIVYKLYNFMDKSHCSFSCLEKS